MENKSLLQKLVKELDFIENVYDYIRLIDPLKKQVINYSKHSSGKAMDAGQKCYALWDVSMACENCISMRALNQKRTIVKIGYKNPNVYLISAVPVQHEGGWLVVELFKDITNDGIIDVEGLEIGEIQKVIDRKNSLIVRDAFTRIYNEKFIFEKLPHDIFRAKEENRKLTLFIISINNYNEFHNLYGFQKGDEIIKEFTKVLIKYCRKDDDWSARYSGSKFIVVMFDLDEKQAYRVCKRMHDKLNKLAILAEPPHKEINFSIGFQSCENEISTPDQLIKAAMKNLYSDLEQVEDKKSDRISEEILPQYLLTEREKAVALLLLQGHSNSQIAETLFVGLSTVKKHIANIFAKSGVKSRAEFISRVKVQK